MGFVCGSKPKKQPKRPVPRQPPLASLDSMVFAPSKKELQPPAPVRNEVMAFSPEPMATLRTAPAQGAPAA